MATVAGFWAWLASRPSKAQDDASIMAGAAAFQTALNLAAGEMVKGLRADIDLMRREIVALKEDNERCRRESEQLRQHARQQDQRYNSLVAYLRAKGVDVPMPVNVIELNQAAAAVDLAEAEEARP